MSTNKFVTLVSGVQRLVQAISSSAGVGDANKIVATGSNGRIDNSLMPVGIGAQTETIVAGETLAAGDFVNIYDNTGTRTVRKADASNNRPAHGFVLSNVSSAANATVYTTGLNNSLTSLTPGQERFLSASTPGASTATAPSTSGQIVQSLGFATATTALLYEYNQPIALDA